jgi:hypothetical protein
MVIVCPSLTKATASSMLTSLSGIARMKCAATKKLFGSIGVTDKFYLSLLGYR